MTTALLNDNDAGIFENTIATANAGVAAASDGASMRQAEHQYVTFTIDAEEYGAPILKVQEIRGWMKTTPLPNTPAYVRGVTNLRGNIVPVFDLRARFCGKPTEVTERHVVIMVQIDGRTVGLLVDAISDILSIDKTKIQPPPTDGLVVDTQYLDGLVATDDRMVALLNITKIFNADVIKSLHAQTTTTKE